MADESDTTQPAPLPSRLPGMWLVTSPDPGLAVLRSPLGLELHVWRLGGTYAVWCWRGRGIVEAVVGSA